MARTWSQNLFDEITIHNDAHLVIDQQAEFLYCLVMEDNIFFKQQSTSRFFGSSKDKGSPQVQPYWYRKYTFIICIVGKPITNYWLIAWLKFNQVIG